MAQTPARPGGPGETAGYEDYPTVDPWQAVSYLVSGVAVWGLIGWGLATWLNAPWLIGVGVVLGGVLGVYLVYLRYGRPNPGATTPVKPTDLPDQNGPQPGERHRAAQEDQS